MDSLQKDYDTAKSIGEQFLNAFFNKGPVDYSIYYGNDSVLTFESDVYFGASNITAKLQSLNVTTTFTHCDIQPRSDWYSSSNLRSYLSSRRNESSSFYACDVLGSKERKLLYKERCIQNNIWLTIQIINKE